MVEAAAAAAAATPPEVVTREGISTSTHPPRHIITTASRTTIARMITTARMTGATSRRSSCPTSLTRGKAATFDSTTAKTITATSPTDTSPTDRSTAAPLKRAATPATTREAGKRRTWSAAWATRSVDSRTGRGALEVAVMCGK